jgi:hypothetical protein
LRDAVQRGVDAVEGILRVDEVELVHVPGDVARVRRNLPLRHRRDEALAVLVEIPGIRERQGLPCLVQDIDRELRRRFALRVEVRQSESAPGAVSAIPAAGRPIAVPAINVARASLRIVMLHGYPSALERKLRVFAEVGGMSNAFLAHQVIPFVHAPQASQLSHALAVWRHGSFRRAAAEQHLSQPALSRSIQNLEESLGVLLFDRQTTRSRRPHLARPCSGGPRPS